MKKFTIEVSQKLRKFRKIPMTNVFLFLFFCFVTTLKLAVIRYNFSIALQKRCTYIRFDEYPTSRRRVLNMYVQAIFCLFSSWKSIKRYAPLLAPKQSDLFREQVRQVFPPIRRFQMNFVCQLLKLKKGKKRHFCTLGKWFGTSTI